MHSSWECVNLVSVQAQLFLLIVLLLGKLNFRSSCVEPVSCKKKMVVI